MRFLRQNTTAAVVVGPFLSATDGVTPQVALANQSANARLVKVGAGTAFVAASWAHDASGHYIVGLSTAHTDTIGRLRLSFSSPADYAPVWEDFAVLAGAVHDVLFGTAAPSTHTAADAATAVAGRFGQPGTVTGTPTAGSFTSSVAGSGLIAVNGAYAGMYAKFNVGTLNANITRKISSYTVSGDVATFGFGGAVGAADGPFPVAPVGGEGFLVIGHG